MILGNKPVTYPIREEIHLTEEDLEFINNLIFNEAGIYLDDKKKSMVESRLSKRIIQLNLGNYHDYVIYLKKHPEELTRFINSLTTNKTDFFRENDHFNFLKNTWLREFHKKTRGVGQTIYAWSAASSKGHEAYTLAMILDEFIRVYPSYEYRILGSDIDTEVIKFAERGIFSEEAVKEVPLFYRNRYFETEKEKGEIVYKISDNLKKNIKFRQHNLVDMFNKIPIEFDIIFLRNVLIYFPTDVIEKVILKMDRHLKTGGIFFIGHAETINNVNHNLTHLGSAIYKKEK